MADIFPTLPVTQRAAIVRAIKRAMWQHNDMSRIELAKLIKRSDDCIEDALNERNPRASDRTITLIEKALGKPFLPTEAASVEKSTDAPEAMGGYSARSVKEYIGEYVCIRPLFDGSRDLNAYFMDIDWKDTEGCLTFQERERYDGRHTQNGTIYINKQSYLSLVTTNRGDVRHIILCELEEGVLGGLVQTLAHVKGSAYIPVSAPFILRKTNGKRFEVGKIDDKKVAYKSYRQLLQKAAEDGGSQISAPSENVIAQRPILAARRM